MDISPSPSHYGVSSRGISPLSSHRANSQGLVHHLEAPDSDTLRRLLSLGFTREAEVTVDHRSFFGDLQITIRGSRLALRADEARMIWVSNL